MHRKKILENEITPRAGNNRKRMNSRISEICTTPPRRKNKNKTLQKKQQKQSQKETIKIGLLQDYVDTK